MDVIREIFGAPTLVKFKSERRTDMLEFQRDFEVKKRNIREVVKGRQKPIVVQIPACLNELYNAETGKTLEEALRESKFNGEVQKKPGNKLGFSRELLEKMFEEAKSGIVQHVRKILATKLVGEDISAILIVGGFATSKIIVDAVKEEFPDMRVVVPNEPGLAVVKGAVLYGHAPLSIASRVCKYTYGVGVLGDFDPKRHPEAKKLIQNNEVLCKDVFDKFVEIGASVSAETPYEREYDVTRLHAPMDIQIFASEEFDPILTSDCSCHLLGKITIQPPEGGWSPGAKFTVKMEFGGTEFRVSAVDSQNKDRVYETSFDFLANVSQV